MRTVNFTAYGISTYPVSNYQWYFGDGSTAVTRENTISHEYAGGDVYSYTVIATDIFGFSTSYYGKITTAAQTNILVGDLVTLTDSVVWDKTMRINTFDFIGMNDGVSYSIIDTSNQKWRQINDAISVSDVGSSSVRFTRSAIEYISITEKIDGFNYSNPFSESLTISDSMTRVAKLRRALTDSASVSDKVAYVRPPPPTPPAPSNGSFSTNAASWTTNHNSIITRDTSVYHSSPASGRWQTGDTQYDQLDETFVGTFKKGQTYTVTFKFRGSMAPDPVVNNPNFDTIGVQGWLAGNSVIRTSTGGPPDTSPYCGVWDGNGTATPVPTNAYLQAQLYGTFYQGITYVLGYKMRSSSPYGIVNAKLGAIPAYDFGKADSNAPNSSSTDLSWSQFYVSWTPAQTWTSGYYFQLEPPSGYSVAWYVIDSLTLQAKRLDPTYRMYFGDFAANDYGFIDASNISNTTFTTYSIPWTPTADRTAVRLRIEGQNQVRPWPRNYYIDSVTVS